MRSKHHTLQRVSGNRWFDSFRHIIDSVEKENRLKAMDVYDRLHVFFVRKKETAGMHERVDRGDRKDRGQVRVEYGLPIKSRRLGI